MKRTIEITFDADCVDPRITQPAIGYLANWALSRDRYCHVKLHVSAEHCVHASYYNDKGECTYTIYAMNDNGVYSYHS